MRALLSLVLLSAACNPPPPAATVPGEHPLDGEVLLTANGNKVTDKMMDAVTRNTPPSEVEKLKAAGTWLKMVEQVGLGEVLYREALSEKLHEDPAIQYTIAMRVRETLAQEYFQKKIDARVDDAAIKQYYDDRAVQFRRPQARAAHILVTEEAKANELLKQLEGGADFAKLAAEHSEDPASKDNGGELGWFQRDRLLAEVADVAFEAELGKPQGPVQTRFGYHIILPMERRDAIPLADVRDDIRNQLRNDAAELIIKELKANLELERFGEVKTMHEEVSTFGIPGKSPPPAIDAGRMAPGGPGANPHGGGAANPHGGGAANPHGGGTPNPHGGGTPNPHGAAGPH